MLGLGSKCLCRSKEGLIEFSLKNLKVLLDLDHVGK